MTEDHSIKSHLAILLLAAGASSRMRGGDKLLEEVDGIPLLRKLARHACAVSEIVLVCLREGDEARRSVLSGLNCQTIIVPDAAEGMAHSLRAGIAQLPNLANGVMVIPADMPDLTEQDLRSMIAAHAAKPDKILRATSADNQPGHPVVFPKKLFGELRALSGDFGARSVLKRHADSVQLIPLPGCHALTDLDTPEAWQAWRQTRQK
ncbi:NTP transferase domain-containing protein [Shimia sp. MIT1388]|uniref:nucleotidyltransferase family protein n=1 Tax=Shimia sp. MIT1388 TaxID=3096992 RepID=UPI00399B8090